MKWFLIKQNEHYGPFKEEQLHSFFKRKKISKNTLVWLEGWAESKTYSNAFLEKTSESITSLQKEVDDEVKFVEDLPPELPVEVQAIQLKKSAISVEASTAKFEGKLDKVDEIDFIEIEREEKLEVFDSIDEPGSNNEDSWGEITKKSSNKLIPVFYGSIFILILFATGVWFYSESQGNYFARPANMSFSHFEKLQKIAKVKKRSTDFGFTLSRDKKNIWISSNNPLEGEVLIEFKSIDGKTLGGKTQIKGSATLKNHLLVMDEFEFIEGSFITDGYYEVSLQSLRPLESSFFQKYFVKAEREVNFQEDVLISTLSRLDFNKSLKKVSAKKKENNSEFVKELAQKYKTIKMITTQIQSAVEKVFIGPVSEWRKRVDIFEKEYKRNFGIFFTRFVIANEDSYKSLMKMKFKNKNEVISNYSKLSTIARDIGVESMGILEDLESTKPSLSRIKKIKEKSRTRLNKIVKECELKLQEIQSI